MENLMKKFISFKIRKKFSIIFIKLLLKKLTFFQDKNTAHFITQNLVILTTISIE